MICWFGSTWFVFAINSLSLVFIGGFLNVILLVLFKFGILLIFCIKWVDSRLTCVLESVTACFRVLHCVLWFIFDECAFTCICILIWNHDFWFLKCSFYCIIFGHAYPWRFLVSGVCFQLFDRGVLCGFYSFHSDMLVWFDGCFIIGKIGMVLCQMII